MQLQDAHRNRAFCRLVFLFVVKFGRCKPFAGGMEIFNGFTWRYVARTTHSLAPVFFPARFRKSQTGGTTMACLVFSAADCVAWPGAILRHAHFRGIRNRRCTLGAKLHLGDSNVD